ncbi:uncharacterized membrane protein YoaK (UPF0700 family) [Frondihabitans australicus]|uniref:Uncharacterized membrane protein YoaK (UPF0700 family) n=2 Tax=Frondihabitans australicus TaxID=386892 RepID=A0A495IM51_9MICO|nr:uncharacterized membrane protein YoaK (UPF0700 family) [Frondihabitans australicus]
MTSEATPRARVHLALVLLALASGATDAFAFLLLGGIFTANMTGNLVLAGLFSRPDWLSTLAGAVTAVVCFAGSSFVGFWVIRPTANADSSLATLRLLGVAVVAAGLQLVIVAEWLVWEGHTTLPLQCAFIGCSAAALGLQTVLAKKISGAAGLTTTFVTGTLTSVMEELADRKRGSKAIQVVIVLSLSAGAFAGTALSSSVPVIAPVLPFVLVAAAVILVVSSRASLESMTAKR